MSLSAKLNAAVDRAFAAASDLVKTGTLTSKAVSSYDFANQKTISRTTTKTVEVIITTKQRASGESFSVSAIMRTGVDLSVYDTLTVDKTTYKIVDYNDNDFVIEAKLKREVK
jgi:hypothetical protein